MLGHPIFMDFLGSALQITGIALEICILVLLWRRNLFRTFPLFFSYVLYVLIRTIVCLVTLSTPYVYFYVYWITAPGEVILMILATYESLLRVFRVFYLLPWFRVVFPAGIAMALLYSGVRGYLSPPVHASAVSAAIISAMLTGQYVILTIALGFFALARLLRVPWRIHEYRFVLGFGISAVATALAASVRSDFGTRFAFLSGMLPAVTYILVLAIWLSAVVHPLPARSKIEAAGEQPEEVVRRLRQELAAIRSLLRRG
jgi:hypothetical protein